MFFIPFYHMVNFDQCLLFFKCAVNTFIKDMAIIMQLFEAFIYLSL